ncbi:hypothetical protein BKM20_13270 [Pseudomonas avellanae]|uniref:Uncharacterized protein n=2 Tax=Pseudomonas avellanae TaxID=46257 RepID=A0AAD0GRD9_9PSED|nr:hypothetical protein BKM03_22430 [Pseudomonas avellanae]EGH11456.1 hypothetical protein PSYMP_17410 [Pseudomonas amygdali pv. morsprunorum str. M302280]KWS58777.1 hypothetical protein AL055_04800 [Pseudomonas amygdali pv. morsprunorum]PHN48997.1 hypothetical protein AO261_22860 [Pseudomonas avellanae]POC93002.1 hypothetical protein BKM26_13395 [Pseudomonas avellanae]
MGCEAALKQVNPVVPDKSYAPGLLPVPGSSRTSPLLHTDIPADRQIAEHVKRRPVSLCKILK